jgi:glutamate synthase (NADPH/NADH) large chain
MTGGRVVVLGETGRNVAAGMSGGVAYVLDLQASRVNLDMVDIEPVEDDDLATLQALVARHASETGSPVAAGLLAAWEDTVARFAKIMPRDYKRVLEAARAAEETGIDVDEAIMAAAHG